ncbi:MAG: oxygenase MpaB family protein, partial [Massilia sp.]
MSPPRDEDAGRAAPTDQRLRADPLADDTIADLFGHGHEPEPARAFADHCRVIAIVNREMESWQSNGAIAGWRASAITPPEIAQRLEAYLRDGLALPAWADAAKIERAETLFMDYGMLSCTLLFCSSLPECYVVPDLAAVLHVAGQLEMHTDHRIRATAAMIFPVMMKGGLTRPDGGGVAQVLKVRLIHATIRHMILRGNPALAAQGGEVAPLAAPPPDRETGMYRMLFEHGWDVAGDGLPCNQEELAYTLLTFSYVFLRSLRKLGLGLASADEEAYLHAWNVMGHVLGIEAELMAHSMAEAEARFTDLQTRGRAQTYTPDARPALGAALMNTMQSVIPLRLIRPFPVLLTRYLCGKTT